MFFVKCLERQVRYNTSFWFLKLCDSDFRGWVTLHWTAGFLNFEAQATSDIHFHWSSLVSLNTLHISNYNFCIKNFDIEFWKMIFCEEFNFELLRINISNHFTVKKKMHSWTGIYHHTANFRKILIQCHFCLA